MRMRFLEVHLCFFFIIVFKTYFLVAVFHGRDHKGILIYIFFIKKIGTKCFLTKFKYETILSVVCGLLSITDYTKLHEKLQNCTKNIN